MSKIFYLLTCFLAAVALSACGGGGSDSPKTWNVGSSVADNGVESPVYWVDGAISALSKIRADCPGYAADIELNGADFYISGATLDCDITTLEGSYVAAYWKNGQRTDLPKPADGLTQSSGATGIVMFEGSLYVAGYAGNKHQTEMPVYWKDGRVTYLPVPDEEGGGYALGMETDAKDLYIFGYVVAKEGIQVPAYWKNGQLVQLEIPKDFEGAVNDMGFLNGTVYAAGVITKNVGSSEILKPVYWINGKMTALVPVDAGDYGEILGFDVLPDGTLYLGGWFAKNSGGISTLPAPTLWINSASQSLSMPDETLDGRATNVMILSKDSVYVTGFNYVRSASGQDSPVPVACNWINGKRADLSHLSSKFPGSYSQMVLIR